MEALYSMDDAKIVHLNRAREKRVRDDAVTLLNISREIAEIEDRATRERLEDAWRSAAISIFSASPPPG